MKNENKKRSRFECYLFPFSAKSKEQLQQRLRDIIDWFQEETFQIEDLAFTLALGRSHFAVRAALAAETKEELKEKILVMLEQMESMTEEKDNSRKGRVKELQKQYDNLSEQLDGIETAEEYKRALEKIGQLYVEGVTVKWEYLMKENAHKIPLPSYPFKTNKYWLDCDYTKAKNRKPVLCNVIDENCSTMDKIIFRKTFSKEEFYLKDHIVDQVMILPGVVHLEMAVQALELANPGLNITSIQKVSWLAPIKLKKGEEEKNVEIHIYTGEENEFCFEIISEENGRELLHSEGLLYTVKEDMQDVKKLSIDNLIKGANRIKASAVYHNFSNHKLHLKKSFQAIMELFVREEEAVGFLELPLHLRKGFESFRLHPSIMDGALEAVISLVTVETGKDGVAALPYYFEKLELYGKIPMNGVTYAYKSKTTAGENVFDVCLADEDGTVCACFYGFTLKEFYQKEDNSELHCFVKRWEKTNSIQQVKNAVVEDRPEHVMVVIADTDALVKGLQAKTSRKICYVNCSHMQNSQDIKEQLKQIGKIDEIIHLNSYKNGEELEEFSEQLALIQASVEQESIRVLDLKISNRSSSILSGADKGLYKTAMLEQSSAVFSSICIDSMHENSIADIVLYELDNQDTEATYREEGRMIPVMEELEDSQKSEASFRRDGVYFITGGMGKLGLVIAYYLAEHYQARLVLTGRRKKDAEIQREIEKLEAAGGRVLYVEADVTKKEELKGALKAGKRAFGVLNGVIHCAGKTNDSYLVKKNMEQAVPVLMPKIAGIRLLDELTKEESLDVFLGFSSIAAVIGNFGQGDYAYANAYMDSFIEHREWQRKQGMRSGKGLSINWSFWKDGGMSLDEKTLQFAKTVIGIAPIENEEGIRLLEEALRCEETQVLAVKGEKKKLEKVLKKDRQKVEKAMSSVSDQEAVKKAQDGIIEIISQMMEIDKTEISLDEDMEAYGFYSLTFTELTNAVNNRFHLQTTPALLFQYPTIREFAEYLVKEYADNFCFKEEEAEEQEKGKETKTIHPITVERLRDRFKKGIEIGTCTPANIVEQDEIAVIGISGIFAESENLEEFWKNLADKQDLTSVIPKNRWDWEELDRKEKEFSGNTVSRYGSFIRDFDCFDRDLFRINPREASLMDPQQRIFLQTVWSVIEDAGYCASSLSGSRTGLFVGVATNDYSQLLQEYNVPIEAYSSTGISHCVLANRISYLFNFHGPSEPVDTACSSSLIAIHRAVESIRSGECEQAIAGGVNIMMSPTLHISFSRAGMLAKDGKCKTFDKRADGYVRGEGSGAILLKPLKKALKDGDHIYALVKGTAVNHGGKVSSLTVPNPKAQMDVLTRAYKKAGFAPDTISYIETHGTGTNLGDPIEVNALKDAFSNMYKEQNLTMVKKQYCGLGTVKTNIGHLEAAAGIAGILKVIESMRHKKIPGIVNFREQNPYINLENSPFYIVKETQEWKTQEGTPRRAGVSSFGFGGANAHIALEEYNQTYQTVSGIKEYPFVLSAKTSKQLKEKAADLIKYIETVDEVVKKELTLENISYTLCVGREDMEVRAAFKASEWNIFIACLKAIKEEKDNIQVSYNTVRDVKKDKMEEALKCKEVEPMMKAWLQGKKVNWQEYFQGKGNRISLPCYPFKKESCWFEIPEAESIEGKMERLHPMVDSNESTMEEERFKKVLHIEEMYLKDHVVGGKVLLPGVAYLEMVRAAAVFAGIHPVSGLKDIRWIQTLQMDTDVKEVYIGFTVSGGEIVYQVYSEADGYKKVYSDGKVLTEVINAPSHIDLAAIQARCHTILEKDTCYNHIFKGVGFDYGPAFRVTERAYCEIEEGLAKICLPEYLKEDSRKYILHPSLLDGAVRSISWTGERSDDTDLVLRVPYAMDRIEVLAQIPAVCYAYARPCEGSTGTDSMGTKKYNIQVVDELGNEVVRIYGFSIKQLVMNEDNEAELGYFTSIKEECPLEESKQEEVRILVLSAGEEETKELKTAVAEKYSYAKKEIITAYYGEEWKQINDTTCLIDATKESFLKLFEVMKVEKGQKIAVLHGWNLKPLDKEKTETPYLMVQREALKTGLYSALHLLQAATEKEIKADIVIGYVEGEGNRLPILGMMKGFVHSYKTVNRNLSIRLVNFLGSSKNFWQEKMAEELFCTCHESEIFYDGTQRKTENWKIEESSKEDGFIKGGVYLVTGGTGAIGKKIARHLAKQYQAKVVLTGRKELGSDSIIDEIESLGGKGYFVQADVADREAVRKAVDMARKVGSRINGIIHCAGIGDETNVLEGTDQSFEKILSPKVQGVENLDLETKKDALDFMLLFSSVSVQIGDMGTCSYASANAFLDKFAEARNEKVLKKQRYGKTISINWPLWKDGRYRVDAEQEKILEQYYGLRLMEDEVGMKALEHIAKGRGGVVFVSYGNLEQTKRMLVRKEEKRKNDKQEARVQNGKCLEKAMNYVRDVFAKTIHIGKNQINIKAPFDSFGIDSIMIIELNKELAEVFPNLSKTIFYECDTIEKLAQYLVENYYEEIISYFRLEEQTLEEQQEEVEILPTKKSFRNGVFNTEQQEIQMTQQAGPMDIAVIGLDGKFPMAQDVYQLWENLKDGKDCITEIPASRWDYHEDYDEEKGKKGKIYTKYGGFIDDVDKFDPQFFQMTPRDAVLTDPQERLFLECAYHTIEDAGYTRDQLAQEKTGVFVGVMYGHYQIIGTEANRNGGMTPPNSSFASVANRVSYIFNWKGPSIALDTMCSSSLTALHLACESIRNGESDVALAGGVNVTIHKNKYIFLCSQRFASSEGKCRAFGEGGDGYVAGEGVGAVLLKPLTKAIQDGDHIYGVIKGTAVNAGGKTSGYTVPNPNAQASVILDAIKKAQVNPRTISYVEAHGTGTSLGDPIEVTGLTKAFGKYTKDTEFCALGSVKSNIGHLESAAGIASVAKVLLQMKYKMLVPSIYSEPANVNLNFNGTPFYVQKTLKPWTLEGSEVRRAGISSFGAGGANVHVIMEEYKEPAVLEEEYKERIYVFSAKNKERLQEKVEQFLAFLKSDQRNSDHYTASSIAYTLQIGREEMEERMAVIAKDIEELAGILERVVQEREEQDLVFRGNSRQAQQLGINLLGIEDEDRSFVKSIIKKNNLERVCSLWVMGNHIEWMDFYTSQTPCKVSLPGYPFERESYWIQEETEAEKKTNVLHPLLDSNVSTLREQVYKKTLSVKEFFLRDHVVSNQILLPGVAYIEMARAAAELAGENKVGAIEDIEWLRPVIMTEDTKELYISFNVEESNLYYNIYSKEQEERILHSRGKILYAEDWQLGQLPQQLDVEAIHERCTTRKDRKYCYEVVFKALGFDYGPSFQVTNEVASGDGETIASLTLSEEYAKELKNFVLHPALFDGAVRSVAVGNQRELVTESYIPFTLGRIEIYDAIPKDCYVYTKVKSQMDSNAKGINRFDISILDMEGKEVVRLIDFTVRPLKGKKKKVSQEELYYYQGEYVEEPLDDGKQKEGKAVVIFTDDLETAEQLKQEWLTRHKARQVFLIKEGNQKEKMSDTTWVIRSNVLEDYHEILEYFKKSRVEVTHMLHMWKADRKAKTDSIMQTKETLEKGIYSIMKLMKEFTKVFPGQQVSCVRVIQDADMEPAEKLVPSFARSIVTINHNFALKNVMLTEKLEHVHEIVTKELFLEPDTKEIEVAWKDGRRLVRKIHRAELEKLKSEAVTLRNRGVYLITGGCGALGKRIARHLVKEAKATVILTGRKAMNKEIKQFMGELDALGGKGVYYSLDVSDKEAFEKVIHMCEQEGKGIHGVFHCAGIGGKNSILDADWEEVLNICRPKIEGVIALDECTRNCNLDFMILFSSISAEIGDLGVGSYAIANSYMNYFAEARNMQVKNGLRTGMTISINWALWKDGGFGLPDGEEATYSNYLGLKLINEQSGMQAMHEIMKHPLSSVIVALGERKKIERALKVEEKNQIVELLEKLKSGDITEAQAKQFIGGIL